MNEEAGFLAALAADPFDEVTRLVYADWLQDHDRPRAIADGYAALGRMGWGAYCVNVTGWTVGTYSCCERDRSAIPNDWYDLVVPGNGREGTILSATADYFPGEKWMAFDREIEAVAAVALAFTRLPAARQAELLRGPVAAT